MKKHILALAAAVLALAGCSKSLGVKEKTLEGSWYLTSTDSRVVEDGSVYYTFLPGGSGLMQTYNFLDSNYGEGFYTSSWSIEGNLLKISTESESRYHVSRKSKDKLLFKDADTGNEYYWIRLKGTDYESVKGAWTGDQRDTKWVVWFADGRRCHVQTSNHVKLSLNKAVYLCFWLPDNPSSFNLVDDDMKPVYFGYLREGNIILYEPDSHEPLVYLSRQLDE